jgi:hypothetical protein
MQTATNDVSSTIGLVKNIMTNSVDTSFESNPINKNFETDLVSSFFENNTLPIENSFYMHNNDVYACLETVDITNKIFNKPNTISFHSGIITKIILEDFAPSQYTLNINQQNVMTAKLNLQTLKYEFDFSSPVKSQTLQILINVHRSTHEPEILDRDDYLNFYRLDHCNINCSNNTFLKQKQSIKLIGYFNNNGIWQQEERILDIYPHNTNRLYLHNVTDSITIDCDQAFGLKTLIVRINDVDVYNGVFTEKWTRIKFVDPNKQFNGAQNKFLSEYINKNTLNMLSIHKLEIIILGANITKVNKHYFHVYNYFFRTEMFAT